VACIKNLADDLARAQGGETPVTRAMADAITQEIDALSRALARLERSHGPLSCQT
jgi:hypothetical protein